MRSLSDERWSNSSVTTFAQGSDPVQKMIHVALSVALEAIQNGWEGPPFDPFRLAEHLKIKIVPCENVTDARTVPIGSDRIQIEYNPSRPQQRIRFSIAHEIAHTFFPDCAEQVRYRASKHDSRPSDWELELLCNLGAAELLMPTGTLPDLKRKRLTIEGLLDLRKEYEVSSESLALRYVNITEQPAGVFVASRNPASTTNRYSIDYVIGSRSWPIRVQKGFTLPEGAIVEKCTAIGAKAKGQEIWTSELGKINVESFGLPPYSNSPYPRVLGLIHPEDSKKTSAPKIQYVVGDATEFGGSGVRILAHVVNDKTPNWGAGFGRAVRESWPMVQDDFRSWTLKNRSNLTLGNVFVTRISKDTLVAPMICQRGYGPSDKPRLRYVALKQCLEQIMKKALELKASVHMPRIGAGYAGGEWGLIEQLIDENLCRWGVPVTIYDLAKDRAAVPELGLFDSMRL